MMKPRSLSPARLTVRAGPAKPRTRKARRETFDAPDHRLEFLGNAMVKLDGQFGIFFEDAAKHLAVEPQHLRIGLRRSAGQPPRVGDQRQFAHDGAGAGAADDALLLALAVEHEASRNHDIGRIGGVVLAIEFLAGGKRRRLCAEGEQTQLFLREAFEKPHHGKGADIVIQRHNVPEPSGQSPFRAMVPSRIMLVVRCGPAPNRVWIKYEANVVTRRLPDQGISL
jgi:hypothetical protein